jgi:hypothetical protein
MVTCNMQLFRGRMAFLPLLVLSLTLAMPARSQDSAVAREALAEKIVSNQADRTEQTALEAAFAENTSRYVFKRLRTDPKWGPEHPNWKKLYPEFSAAFISLSKGLVPELNSRLKTALVSSLTEKELAEVDALLNDAKYVETVQLLRKHGIDNTFALRVVGVSRTPLLYSQAERAAVKEKIEELSKADSELAALKPKLDATMAGFKTPTAVKYQQLVANVMLDSFRKINADEATRQKMDAFVADWRTRVGQD